MAKISLICEQCGGNIILDNSHEIGTCESCFAKFVIKQDQIVQKITQNITKHIYGYQGKDVEELVAEGYSMLNLGNKRQANSKFNQAIDIEPDCWNAWLGYATSLPDNYKYLISKVKAYKSAFDLARNEQQQIDTYIDMTGYIPDSYLRSTFIRAFNLASNKERRKIFNLVSGVIGCDDSEVASLAIDLCPSDWRAHFAMGKFRQVRARWAEIKGFFHPRLSDAAAEVLNIFVKSYNLAKNKNDINGVETVKTHIERLTQDNSYRTFATEALKYMK